MSRMSHNRLMEDLLCNKKIQAGKMGDLKCSEESKKDQVLLIKHCFNLQFHHNGSAKCAMKLYWGI